jgi:hypothetical protein
MIIQIEGPDPTSLEQARSDLAELAGSWGQEISDTSSTPAGTGRDKAVDPLALASLIISLPSAALAVGDLADRIRKRRRAGELIEHARSHAARQVTITVITPGTVTQLTDLNPDEILDLQAGDDPQ